MIERKHAPEEVRAQARFGVDEGEGEKCLPPLYRQEPRRREDPARLRGGLECNQSDLALDRVLLEGMHRLVSVVLILEILVVPVHRRQRTPLASVYRPS